MTLTPVHALACDDAFEICPGASRIVVIGPDVLVAAIAQRFPQASIRAFDDLTPLNHAAEGFTRVGLTIEGFTGADLVVGELPKSIAELTEIASLTAHAASPTVMVTLSGREKYLSRGMNDALSEWFDRVWASRGRQKSRALRAASPRISPPPLPFPRRSRGTSLDVDIVAHGGAFAGASLDIGTRALVDAWAQVLAEHRGPLAHVVDLGSGTGVLAALAATRLPNATVTATDRSWAAIASSLLTVKSAGFGDRVRVVHEDAGASIDDSSADLVLLNPPFHDGTAVDSAMADGLFRAAARMLRRDGSLAVVFNSHLGHRVALERIVGPTRQLLRTPKFTVTLTRRR